MAIKSNNDAIFNEINITPLTDIFLVLLIIMMVIAPMFQNIDQNIEIPEINSGLNVEQKEIIVSITKDGLMYLNKKPTTKDNLVKELIALKSETQEKSIVVQADKETRNKEVISVIQAAQAAGLEKLTIAGEPLSKRKQRELQQQAPPPNDSLTPNE